MHFVFAADDAYAMPLAVAIDSLFAVLPEPDLARVTVLSDSISPDNQAKIRSSSAEATISFVDVSALLPVDLAIGTYVSRATYARLFAPGMLMGQTERLLYLDCDMVVVEDPTPLFTAPIGNAVLAAARDVDAPVASCPGGLTVWREAKVDPHLPLYNAGLLLIDCARWDDSGAAQRVVDYVRAHPATRFADQDGINVALAGEIADLPLRWNAQPPLRRKEHLAFAFYGLEEVEEAIANPGIIHYAEGTKPWHYGSRDPSAALWWEILAGTSWADFPRPEPPSLRLRAIRATRRAFSLGRGKNGSVD